MKTGSDREPSETVAEAFGPVAFVALLLRNHGSASIDLELKLFGGTENRALLQEVGLLLPRGGNSAAVHSSLPLSLPRQTPRSSGEL